MITSELRHMLCCHAFRWWSLFLKIHLTHLIFFIFRGKWCFFTYITFKTTNFSSPVVLAFSSLLWFPHTSLNTVFFKNRLIKSINVLILSPLLEFFSNGRWFFCPFFPTKEKQTLKLEKLIFLVIFIGFYWKFQ